MILHYQPILEVETGRVVRLETFCRSGSAYGMDEAATYIDSAESTGYITDLTREVVARALQDRKHFPLSVPMSFNISVHNLREADFVAYIDAVAKDYAIEPALITLELRDGIQGIDDGPELQALRALRDRGCRISVDGFGPELSQFSYLEVERIGASELKVAAELIAQYYRLASRVTVSSVVDLAKHLHLDVVAKNVETQIQLDEAFVLGCRYAQGHFFAKPMGAREIAAWLSGRGIVEPAVVAREPEAGVAGAAMAAHDTSSAFVKLARVLFADLQLPKL
ncbi:MAG: hypothetical protein NVS2B8_05980 [Vulcanimicrobiaceae bacterium]